MKRERANEAKMQMTTRDSFSSFSNWCSFFFALRPPRASLVRCPLLIPVSGTPRSRARAPSSENNKNETLEAVELRGCTQQGKRDRKPFVFSLFASFRSLVDDSSSHSSPPPPSSPPPSRLVPPQQLLGLHGRDYLDAQIISAYEELASAPPPPGFSRRALDGRGLLLQEALQQLRAARGAAARAGAPRDAPPGPPAGLALDAPLLPGALALLQEVGECEVVLSAGASALRNGIPVSSSSGGSSSSSSASPPSMPLPPSAERDVRLAMAHAHCALAGATLEKGADSNGSSTGGDAAASTGDSSSPSFVAATAAPISVACAHLAEAAALLAGAPVASGKKGGASSSPSSSSFPPLAPKLAADVARGLADLAPGCALEQLDLPLDQGHAPVRAAAVAVVAHALRAASAKKSGGDRKEDPPPLSSPAVTARPATPEFAKAALSRMGAAEVAFVLDWGRLLEDATPYEHWLFPGAVGAAGAAHVVAGFVGRRPALVDLGERLLAAEADAVAAVAAGSGGSPLAPRVAALVLLGEPEAAAELLTTSAHALEREAASSSSRGSGSRGGSSAGLSSAAARARAAAADVEFVAAASRAVAGGGGGADGAVDALPGLVALAEEWLSRGGFPAFRDTAERPASPKLSGYFDDGRVAAALDARAASKERSEGGAAAGEGRRRGGAAVASAAVGAARAVAAAAALVVSAIPLPAPAPPSLILPRVPGARAAASAAAASRGGRGLVSSVTSPSTLARFLGGAALLSAVAAAALSPSARGGGGVGSVGGITARQQQQQAQQEPRRSVFSGLEQQRKQQKSSSSTPSAAAAAAAALPPAAVRSAGAASTSSPSASGSTASEQRARPSPLARFSTSLAASRASAAPTPRQAEAAIGAWHSAKAAALGPRHDTSRLPATAAEPWRSAVERDAAAARQSGWFWTFKLRGLRVERVEAKGAGKSGKGVTAAVAHARVREAGDLYARTGKRSDGHSYDNAYSAEYTLVRSSSDDGAEWKVAGVLVTGEPRSRSA